MSADDAAGHAAPEGAAASTSSPWRRLLSVRATRAQLLVAALCGLLGFALVTQARSTGSTAGLAGARQEDLVGILNDLTARSNRLSRELDQLQATRDRLTTSSDQRAAAAAEAQRRAQTLGIIAGTLAARGPGIVLTIDDPKGKVRADVLLDALEELRDAGAEAMQIGPVRAVASTYFLDADGGVRVDGVLVRPPYRFLVIGDPRTLTAALAIPGGVADTVAAAGGGAKSAVTPTQQVLIRAVRSKGGTG